MARHHRAAPDLQVISNIDQMRKKADELLQLGQFQAAIVAHENVLKADSNDIDTAYNLAWLFRTTGQLDAAAAAYQRVIQMGGEVGYEARLGLAAVLIDQRREDEAEEHLRDLLAWNPAHLPALLNLGRIEEDRGQRERSARTYRKAHEAAPEQALPLARLLGVLTPGQEKSALIDRAAHLLQHSPYELIDRCDLGFALAAALDESGQFGSAWDCLESANSAASTLERANGRGFDPIRHSAYVESVAETFARWPVSDDLGRIAATPVFICGMFRSGSSLLEQVLGRHSQVSGGGELDVLSRMAAALPNYPTCVPQLSEGQLDGLRDEYLAAVRPLVDDVPFVIDKSPENFLHIGLIMALWPNAVILDTRRTREDNLLSCYFQHLTGRDYANSPESLALWHSEYLRLMDIWNGKFENRILECHYERLVGETEITVRNILDFIGLDFEPKCLQPNQSEALVRTASVWQVREKIHTRSVGRAMNYPDFQRRIG